VIFNHFFEGAHMSGTTADRSAEQTVLPGATVLKRVRRLLRRTLGWALVYSILATGSRSTCPGGFDSNGGYLDANGDPTEVAPNCITLTLQPSPLILIVLALVVIGALSSALKKSKTEAEALRYLNSAAVVVGVLVGVCIVVNQVWFSNLPVDEWDGLHTNFVYPFPFGYVEMEISQMGAE
jgi:hypothetical protein